MEVVEFLQLIGTGPIPSVLLFCPGKKPNARESTYEPFLAERAAARVVEQCVDPSMRDLGLAAFYADETSPAEVVLESQTLPFLTDRRVVLVRNAERYNTESAAGPLIEYLKSPCPSTILILIAGQIDKRTKFYKSCEKAGTVVECPQLSEQEVSQWVRAEMAAREKSIEPVAVQEIVRRAGTHLSDVNNAIGIVIAYAGDASTIRESDVVAACADVAEEEVWSLTDAIAASQSSAALTSLRKLIDLGKQEDEILGIINWLLKSAYALALGGPSANSISRFVANKVRPLADKLGLQKLRDAFALCTDAHFMIRSTGVDGALALELLVVKLAAPRGRGANPQATRT